MEKQKKFLLVLPLLVIPFLTLAFWALGGGKGDGQTIVQNKGLDTDLPQAQFKDKEKSDKLTIYQSAKRDSGQNGVSPEFLKAVGLDQNGTSKQDSTQNADAQADAIQEKLAKLNKQINEPKASSSHYADEPDPAQVKRLNRMMRQQTASANEPDPELKQLDKMLDKIQAIQNPNAAPSKEETRSTEPAKPFRAIPAVIDGKQKVADGAAVKLRLTDTATIKGQLLEKGQELFGTGHVVNQRLLVNIKTIRLGTQIIPVELTVFSQDGMPGIPAPEAELSGVTSNNADQTLQSMQIMSMDQSIAGQAAAGGINAAKDLFSKKMKKIKVKLSDEYPVLLKKGN
ncbi:conjugative transposon protein TraM [Mucilaginibacter daejeonensis]|uniref:conjugative transposon protein TraM n=1 Tax=Mucilaginibacter daejeonensis TaxID=398049 RepID=UPI001D177C4D|nr:conjugative transposon protein TraM [Mucilaginibacter daejeonensis]UEG54887.1 conjugative transposon protein TraM [Mucilaginibacter daejeonensis]